MWLQSSLFSPGFLNCSVFFFLQTILGTRVTFVGKNINTIAASKSTETYMLWMVSNVLALRHLNWAEKSLGKQNVAVQECVACGVHDVALHSHLSLPWRHSLQALQEGVCCACFSLCASTQHLCWDLETLQCVCSEVHG